MPTESLYPNHLWSYVHRVLNKKAGPGLSSAEVALRSYKPANFGVTMIGDAEQRKTMRDAQVLHMTLSYEGKDYEVYLTAAEVAVLRGPACNPLVFSPSITSTVLKPKQLAATASSGDSATT